MKFHIELQFNIFTQKSPFLIKKQFRTLFDHNTHRQCCSSGPIGSSIIPRRGGFNHPIICVDSLGLHEFVNLKDGMGIFEEFKTFQPKTLSG